MRPLLLLLALPQAQSDRLVQELRSLPPLRGIAPDGRADPTELQRAEVYRQIRELGDDALPALVRGLADPNVRFRRNVALALGALAGWWDPSTDNEHPTDSAGPRLQDEDKDVRAWSAQAIGSIVLARHQQFGI